MISKRRQNQADFEIFKVLKFTKPVDNCNNFKWNRTCVSYKMNSFFNVENKIFLCSVTKRKQCGLSKSENSWKR